MLRKNKIALVFSGAVLMGACQANVSLPNGTNPQPSPQPTATPTASPTASPTPSASPSAVEQVINFNTIIQVNALAVINSNIVITNTQDLANFWKTYVNQTTSPPAVDFNQQCVIVVAAPQPSTTTTTTSTALSVKKTNKQLKVQYRTTTTQTTQTGANSINLILVPQSQVRGDFTQVVFQQVS